MDWQDIPDPATGGSRLLSERCATCILAAGDRMHLGPERLRAIITDALAAGTFVGLSRHPHLWGFPRLRPGDLPEVPPPGSP